MKKVDLSFAYSGGCMFKQKFDFLSGVLDAGSDDLENKNEASEIGPLQRDLVEKLAGSVSWEQSEKMISYK